MTQFHIWQTHGPRNVRHVKHTHTHTRLTALCPGLPRWAGTRKVKPIWILLKQETLSGSGISWAICKSAPRSRQITTPAAHHSVFTGQMPFLQPNQQCQSTKGNRPHICDARNAPKMTDQCISDDFLIFAPCTLLGCSIRCGLLLPMLRGLCVFLCLLVGHNSETTKLAKPVMEVWPRVGGRPQSKGQFRGMSRPSIGNVWCETKLFGRWQQRCGRSQSELQQLVIDNASIVCGAASMERSGYSPYVCPSTGLPPPSSAAAACGRFAAVGPAARR